VKSTEPQFVREIPSEPVVILKSTTVDSLAACWIVRDVPAPTEPFTMIARVPLIVRFVAVAVVQTVTFPVAVSVH
jgi:hypothetical protein